jgi:nicotinamide mononucleotide (NMN) deamidase PncC
MTPAFEEIIRQIHEAPIQAVLAVTGGGTCAISDLLSVSGGSATVLEAIVPYSAESLVRWLGRTPDQACSRETALAMATTAFRNGLELATSECDVAGEALVGLGCTASLVSQNRKRGDHRCWVATHSAQETRLRGLVLDKGARSRIEEERLVGNIVLLLLAESCGAQGIPALDLDVDETIHAENALAPTALAEVWSGRSHCVWRCPNGSLSAKPETEPAAILAGSFDPQHIGHRELASTAEKVIGGLVCYEMAIVNPDKSPLDFLTIESRCQQFNGAQMVLSDASTFVEKSRLFPDTVFVVGVDTAERILDRKYYGGENELQRALQEIRSHGCRFLVAGRKSVDDYVRMADLAVPNSAIDLFQTLSESDFRRDISSTELRRERSRND